MLIRGVDVGTWFFISQDKLLESLPGTIVPFVPKKVNIGTFGSVLSPDIAGKRAAFVIIGPMLPKITAGTSTLP